MASLKDTAKDFVPSAKTKNIADLDSVSTDIELLDDEFEFERDGKVKVVQQKVIVVDNEQYRVPVSVIKQLKVHIEANPELKKFKVKKTGTTKDDTEYTVIPLTA
jgi:hypothetical protein|tara:strand:- start:95 stop:409 length:315 start_codon:yes stop_codon:yes gene_type:complete